MTIMQQKIDEVLLEQKLIRLQRLHINHMLAKLQQQIQPPTRPIGARRRPAVSEPTARARPSQAIGMETEWEEGNCYVAVSHALAGGAARLRGPHSGQRG